MPFGLSSPEIAFLLVTGALAAASGTLAGLGSTLLALSALALVVPARAAVPALVLSQIVQVSVRLFLLRGHVAWFAAWRYLVAATPAAALGAFFFATLSDRLLCLLIAAFLVYTVLALVFRRWLKFRTRPWMLFPVGGLAGAVSAVVGGAGPISGAFLHNLGLERERFVSTMALVMLVEHIVKTATYTARGVHTADTLWLGAVLAAGMLPGTLVGRWLLARSGSRGFELAFGIMLAVCAVGMTMRGLGMWL